MKAQSLQDKTAWLRQEALAQGFMNIGFSKAEFLKEEADRLRTWLDKGYHGKMSYLENHFDKRTDPRKLVEDCKSVVVLSYNYFPTKELDSSGLKVAKYAYGRDYHKVIKKKLKILWAKMQDQFGEVNGRYFVDSGPVMEREWALRSGLGWIGKNTLIIDPKKGSFFFLAVMLTDQEFEYDKAISDHCGTCTRCIDACPTDAITAQGYELNASKCISYLTIELKDEKLPTEFSNTMEDWIFGCDICQDVCPWNKFSIPHGEEEFEPKEALLELKQSDWDNMDEATFDKLFVGSAVKRTGFSGLKRNIGFVHPK